jgi:hypothetical protein
MEFTYTSPRQWESGQYKLGPIPKSQKEQIVLLERAVYEMTVWLMDELGWDNPSSVGDELSDEINQIAQRAFDNHNV